MDPQKINNAVWFWNKKPIKVNNLDDSQINHIVNNVLKKNINGNKFGLKNKEWLEILDKIHTQKQESFIQHIAQDVFKRKQRLLEESFDRLVNKHNNTIYHGKNQTKEIK
jgi:hypothetical protein